MLLELGPETLVQPLHSLSVFAIRSDSIEIVKPPVTGGFSKIKKRQMPNIALALFASVVLSSCVRYAPNNDFIGLKRERLIEIVGQPDLEYESKGFRKLHFVRGPYGQETYLISIDGEDVVEKIEQVLTEENFSLIRKGMNKTEVIDIIGPTKIKSKTARNRTELWHYRYKTYECKSFIIEFSSFGLVDSSGYFYRGGRQCKYVGP